MSEYELTMSEIFQENLLKYSSLNTRQIVHRHSVPAKLRSNNIKSANAQLKKEQINLKTNLNVALQTFKLKQDKKNRKDISELRNKKLQSISKLEQLRSYAVDLNTELYRLEKDYSKRQKFSNFKFKSNNEDKIPADAEKILFKKIIWYNNGVKKLRELRHELEDIFKVKVLKNEAYELIMNQLYRIRRILTVTGGKALKLHNERQQILQYLNILRETSETEKRKMSENVCAALYKYKINYDMTAFLRKKRKPLGDNQRHTRNRVKIHNQINENKITNDELMKFIKFFIRNNVDTDLVKIAENKKINEYKKESLFRLLIFLEQQLAELANSINCAQEIESGRKVANYNRREMNRCQLKMYLDDHQKLTQTIKSSQESTEYLKNTYKELFEIIANACQMLQIRLSTEKPTDRNILLNEDNISDYAKAMVKKSYELIFKVNCIENNCLKKHDEDTLTSDGESMQNLISRDYNGVEIKMRRLIRK